MQHYQVGAASDGTLQAIRLRGFSGMGPHRKSGGGIAGIELFRCPNVRREVSPVYTNMTVAANFRGPSYPQGVWGIESVMDQVAHELEIDPVDFHLRNLTRAFNDETPYTSWALRECVTAGADRFGWPARWRRAGTRGGPLRRGVGMAIGMFAARLGRSSAVLRLERGRLFLHVGVTDIGTAAKTAMAQLAAEAMGMDLAEVTVVWGDTNRCPYSVGESGSRTTTHTGQAILEAAEDLRRQMAAADGPIESRTLIAQATPEPTLDGLARYASAAHFVEVEVDTELGGIRVLEYLAMHESGRIVNPLTAESQVQGGVTMGIGMALHEELLYDRLTGIPVNPGYYGRAGHDASRRARDRGALHRAGRRLRAVRGEERRRAADHPGGGGHRQRGIQCHRPPDSGVADDPGSRAGGAGVRPLANVNPERLADAVEHLSRGGARAAAVGGGSDLLGMIKDDLVSPDLLVNLRTIAAADGLDAIVAGSAGLRVGGLVTLTRLSAHPEVASRCRVLAEAAGSAATPQIRNVATLAGNLCQRPWCWYFRQKFPCYKHGGNRCYSRTGENQFNAIFGGAPSYIVHPSDTAPALVALDARFRLVGPGAERVVPAGEFFTLPRVDVARENVLEPNEILAGVSIPAAPGLRSTYAKVLDREAWTHAVVSVALALHMDGGRVRRAGVVLGGVAPVPWRVAAVEELLAGEPVTDALAAEAGRLAVDGARPLSKNRYKVPLVENLVRRTLLSLAASG